MCTSYFTYAYLTHTPTCVSYRSTRISTNILDTLRTPIERVFISYGFYTADQRGPTAFALQAILQKRDNSRATSNKMMYKATESQHLKLKKGR